MKKNMGSVDKLTRLLISIVLIILFYKEILTGTLGLIALFLALIFTLTSMLSFCPIYAIFGISTCRKEKPEKTEE